MKYDLRKIMKRAWEIKERFDWKKRNQLLVHNDFRELREEEKALFSECLKAAWKEAKRAVELRNKFADVIELSEETAAEMAAVETKVSMDELKDVQARWNIWSGIRAYYNFSCWSKYKNSKRFNYVAL